MIGYEVYKVFHVVMVLFLISTLGFIVEGKVNNKAKKILIGLVSFFIFVGGMGLIARLGFKHGEPFPLWIMLKISLWVLVNIALILVGRMPINLRKWIYLLVLGLVSVAVWSAVYKPGM